MRGQSGMGSRMQVMIVDDDRDALDAFSAILQQADYSVQTASGWYDLFKNLNRSPLPSVILMDISMPQFDGIELLATLKRHHKYHSIPVIVLTAFGQTAFGQCYLDKAFFLGAAAYLEKPTDIDAILGTIREVTTPTLENVPRDRSQ